MEAVSLDRFYRTLTGILDRERPEAYTRPVTVAELYQDIVPYRRMRQALGIELHADYEHALLRLLAGEHGGMRIEPDSAREELGLEASSSEPNLSAYRRFAACEVTIAPAAGEVARPGAEPGAQPGAASGVPGQAPAPVGPPAPAPPAAPPAIRLEENAGAGADDPVFGVPSPDAGALATPAGRTCAFCDEPLPDHVDVRYCPHCGGDQRQRLCRACGEPMQQGWRFCVACGTAADA